MRHWGVGGRGLGDGQVPGGSRSLRLEAGGPGGSPGWLFLGSGQRSLGRCSQMVLRQEMGRARSQAHQKGVKPEWVGTGARRSQGQERGGGGEQPHPTRWASPSRMALAGETKPELEILQRTDFRGRNTFSYKSRTVPPKRTPICKKKSWVEWEQKSSQGACGRGWHTLVGGGLGGP